MERKEISQLEDINDYAISAPDSPTDYPYQKNAPLDIVDIFLLKMELL